MAKQRTNNGPLKESADKHSIYPLYNFLTVSAQQEVAEGTGYRNGPFISLKNGSFKEPLLSVHFVCALGMRRPWAVSLLRECEGATHYETANG
jgi:hypothetical protein